MRTRTNRARHGWRGAPGFAEVVEELNSETNDNMNFKTTLRSLSIPSLVRSPAGGFDQYAPVVGGVTLLEHLHRVPPEDQPQRRRRLEHQPALRGAGRLRGLPRGRAPIHQRRRQSAVPDAGHLRRVPRDAGQAIQRRQARAGVGGDESHAHHPLAADGDDRRHERLRRLPQDRAEDAPGDQGA